MKKCIKIGFISTVETEPGIWENVTIEKKYFSDIIRNSINISSRGEINDTITYSSNVSLIANSYIRDNLHYMKYVIIDGYKWSITSIINEYPRLIISIGGIYNG